METSSPPNDGRGPPKESSSSSSFDGHQNASNKEMPPSPPPQQQPSAVGGPPPPHMMYYASPQLGYPAPGGHQPHHGYPPGPPGYAPYPNEYHPQPYNYGAPQYYGPPPHTYQTRKSGKGFIRGFIMCACVMFTIFFVTTVIMAIVMHPELPVYKVVSLSVDNFNTNTTLTGNWDAVVSVENPNHKLRAYFSDFKVELLYKRDLVAWGYAQGFDLGHGEKNQMEVKSSSNVAGVDMNSIAKEREGGSVEFAMKVSSMAAFRSSTLSTRGETVLAICEGITVAFQNSSANGTSTSGTDCRVYI